MLVTYPLLNLSCVINFAVLCRFILTLSSVDQVMARLFITFNFKICGQNPAILPFQ